jgi:hypothetical protein
MESTTRTQMEQDPTLEQRRTNGNLISLLRELRDETTTLLRQEVSLAKAELSEKTSRLSKNATLMAVGAVFALGAFGLLLLAIRDLVVVGLVAAGMTAAVTAWLAPLIVAAVVGLIGLALLMKGKKALLREGLAPEKTMETLRADKEWAKHRLNKAAA